MLERLFEYITYRSFDTISSGVCLCLGNVGAVAAREVSRFARNSRDWQQLIEMCRVVDTVLIDQETIYALETNLPSQISRNDRSARDALPRHRFSVILPHALVDGAHDSDAVLSDRFVLPGQSTP